MPQTLKNRVLFLITEKERKIGRRIRQAEIAQAIKVSPHTIASWLRGDVTKFEAHVLIGLCNYFGCKIEDLIYIEDEDTSSAE